GALTTFYSGVRPGSPGSSSYYPMHKQGGILLGTGGDNGNGSSGTFYEGVMTTGYPGTATTDAVQANIVAARYDVARVSLSRTTAFTHQSTQEITETFVNTSRSSAAAVKLSLAAPAGWVIRAAGTTSATVAPGATVAATFRVSSPAVSGAGFLSGKAEWTEGTGKTKQTEVAVQRIRNIVPVKINEVRFGTAGNTTNQFIELYNASASAVNLSGWSLVNTQSQWAPVTLARIPAGTQLAAGAYYLLGLSGSGLAGPASAGTPVINVRSIAGFAPGQKIDIDGEMRSIASVGTAAAAMTMVFVPVSTGPRISFPAGSTNLPVTNAAGFEVGQKIGIDAGGNYEVATVTRVGKGSTQTILAAPAMAGATNIKAAANANITAGDALTIGTGAAREVVKAGSVGAAGAIELTAPLRFDHRQGVDVSDAGTGISFSPATRFPHESGDAVQALGSGITLDAPLTKNHAYGAAISGSQAEGYQGQPAPNQWFGGALSTRAGSIALLDAGATVIDAIVYGSQQSNSSGNGTIASPELATLVSDQGKGGCIVVTPPPAAGSGRSRGRFPDGADTGSLCDDFRLQPATMLSLASNGGATNIKVATIADFSAGQSISIDTDAAAETSVIAAVGTAGGATMRAAADAGSTVIPVTSAIGFVAGETITIDSGSSQETAVIAATAGGGRGRAATITTAAPLTHAHAAGAQVSGSGITLAAPLTRAHAIGAMVEFGSPTPGAPNRYGEARH
ncbi:MAG TPA: arabinofuranosidase catalytic domain-containing protein, partial [Bryobacteraceae bacterium]|nr:arabinofuranosidase catalytic domain-containing protein [Bryobacteraceae bacterium]